MSKRFPHERLEARAGNIPFGTDDVGRPAQRGFWNKGYHQTLSYLCEHLDDGRVVIEYSQAIILVGFRLR